MPTQKMAVRILRGRGRGASATSNRSLEQNLGHGQNYSSGTAYFLDADGKTERQGTHYLLPIERALFL